MAHCPYCQTRVTRWWWFSKLLGNEHWTTRCRGCGAECEITVAKEFARAAQVWVVIACIAVFVSIFGMIAFGGIKASQFEQKLALLIGVTGAGTVVFSLIAALIVDVRHSKVTLQVGLVCDSCGERLPRNFNDDVCPVCGDPLNTATRV